MNVRLLGLIVALVALLAVTVPAVLEVGFSGIFVWQLQTWAGMQVLLDLVIVAGLACIWMVNDAPSRGLNAWPFVVITLLAGSFGPLSYLILRELRSAPQR